MDVEHDYHRDRMHVRFDPSQLQSEILEAILKARGGLTLYKKRHAVLLKLSELPKDDHYFDKLFNQFEAYAIPQMAGNWLLPDDSVLVMDGYGGYHIEDREAKVTYKANRVREFNPYMNCSDLLEDFIRYLGTLGVKQSEVLNVPINAFIHWLVFKAAERDGDSVQDVPKVLDVLPKHLLIGGSNVPIDQRRANQQQHAAAPVPATV